MKVTNNNLDKCDFRVALCQWYLLLFYCSRYERFLMNKNSRLYLINELIDSRRSLEFYKEISKTVPANLGMVKMLEEKIEKLQRRVYR